MFEDQNNGWASSGCIRSIREYVHWMEIPSDSGGGNIKRTLNANFSSNLYGASSVVQPNSIRCTFIIKF